jgi:hypothetical protein
MTNPSYIRFLKSLSPDEREEWERGIQELTRAKLPKRAKLILPIII